MIVTRNEILDAIKRLQERMFLDATATLCWAFAWDMRVARYLEALGASEGSYKWRLNEQGHEQRLLFLAFMLTWHDEIMEGKG